MAKDNENLVHFSKTFVEGEFRLGFWGFVKKGVGLFNSFFVLRSLSLYQFGVYQLLLSFYAIASDFFHNIFASVVSNDLARFIAEDREDKAKRLFWEYAFFRVLMGLVPVIAVVSLVRFFSFRYGPDAIMWAYVLSAIFLVDAILSVLLTLLKINLKFSLLAVRPSFQKLVQGLVLAIFFFFYHLSVTEIFIAQLAGSVFAVIVVIPTFVKVYKPWRSIQSAPGSILEGIIFSYGAWEIPGSFTTNLVGKIRPWLIKFFLNTEAVGIFGAASMAISLLKDVIPMRTLSALMPRKINEPEKIKSIFVHGTRFYVAMSLLLVVAGSVIFPVSVNFLFPQYQPSIILFYFLLPTVVLFAFIKMTNILLVVKRRQKFIFYQSVFQQGLGIILIVVFLPTVGILGLALAELFGLLIPSIIKYYYLVRTRFIEHIPLKRFFVFDSEDKKIFLSAFRHLLGVLKLRRFIRKK